MFTGFSDETVDFMWGIRFNNERTWFEAHKDIYLRSFYQPMRELGTSCTTFWPPNGRTWASSAR